MFMFIYIHMYVQFIHEYLCILYEDNVNINAAYMFL